MNHPSAKASATEPVRSTRQRRAVQAELEESEEFRSAQEIHEALTREENRVGLATVYRTLQSLAESGEVDVVKTDAGEARYRRCSPHHHHHLVCRRCGRTVEIEATAVESWTASVAAENGFSSVSHTIELFGVCPDCSAEDGHSTPAT